MTRRILVSLALLALTVFISVGLLHAQGSTEGERPPYRIDLHPGWNLISFPGDPVSAALENVIGADSQVDVVVTYEDAQWEAAVRTTDGGWRTTGGLATMSGGRGYWVHATASGVIQAALSPDTPKPSMEGCRWHLAGVWDAEQRPAGTETDADDYLPKYQWRVAYGYLTDENRWTKQLPGSEGTVETGAGYWVWTTCPSSCPPISQTPIRWGTGATAGVGTGYRARALGGIALSCP